MGNASSIMTRIASSMIQYIHNLKSSKIISQRWGRRGRGYVETLSVFSHRTAAIFRRIFYFSKCLLFDNVSQRPISYAAHGTYHRCMRCIKSAVGFVSSLFLFCQLLRHQGIERQHVFLSDGDDTFSFYNGLH